MIQSPSSSVVIKESKILCREIKYKVVLRIIIMHKMGFLLGLI